MPASVSAEEWVFWWTEIEEYGDLNCKEGARKLAQKENKGAKRWCSPYSHNIPESVPAKDDYFFLFKAEQ